MNIIKLSNGVVIIANKVVKIGVLEDNVTETNTRPTSWFFKIHTLDGHYTYVSGRVQSEVEHERITIIRDLQNHKD